MDLDALDSLLQLLVIVGAGLAWLLGSSRKRPQPGSQPGPEATLPRPGARRKPVTRPAHRSPGAEPVGATAPTPAGVERPRGPRGAGQVPGRQATLEELLRVLAGEGPGRPDVAEAETAEEARSQEIIEEAIVERERRERTPPERTPLEQIFEAEARSLETLEGEGEASHLRFQQRYLESQTTRQARRRRSLVLRPRPETLRQGFLWQVVLGRPKGLE